MRSISRMASSAPKPRGCSLQPASPEWKPASMLLVKTAIALGSWWRPRWNIWIIASSTRLKRAKLLVSRPCNPTENWIKPPCATLPGHYCSKAFANWWWFIFRKARSRGNEVARIPGNLRWNCPAITSPELLEQAMRSVQASCSDFMKSGICSGVCWPEFA